MTGTAYFAGDQKLQAEAVCTALEALGFDAGNRPQREQAYATNNPGYRVAPREYWRIVVSGGDDPQRAASLFRTMVLLMGGEFEAPTWALTPEDLERLHKEYGPIEVDEDTAWEAWARARA